MTTYADLLWQEEEERRRAQAGGVPVEAGRTLPELVGQAAKAIYGGFSQLMKPQIDPYTQSMLEASNPTMTIPRINTINPNIDTTIPMEGGGTTGVANQDLTKLWGDFMGAGGQKAEFRNADGSMTKLVKKEPPAPKQPGQPGVQGVPVQQQPWSGYAQPAQQGLTVAGEDAKLIEAQKAQMVQQELARRNVGNLPYSPVFRPGEGPMSPAQEYQQRVGLAEKERAERQALITQGTPSRGQLLAEQYKNIAASTGKGMRIVMSALNFINKGNPLWTDEMASLGADHEQARQAIIMDRSLSSSDKEYLIKKDAIDRLVMRQTTQRAEAKKNLQERLALEPERVQDPRFLRDHLMAELNIAEKDVPQFLADHYDPNTKTYNIVKSPYEEMIITTKNNANALTELLPTLPPEVAILAGKNQEVILKYFSDKEAQFNYRAGLAKTPEERTRWEERRDFAAANKNRMASDPRIWNLTQLTEQIKDMKVKGTPIPDRLWNDFAAAHKFAYGPSLDRDPKKIYMDYYEQGERIKGHILDNEYKTGQITLQKEKGKQAANIVDDAIGTFPGNEMFRSKKANVDTMNELYRFHQAATQMAMAGTIPTGDKPEEKKVRAYIDHLRGKVVTQLPTDIKKDLGPLSDKEMIYLANNIYSAQTSSPPHIPNLYYMAELIRRERAGRSGGKKK